MKNGIIIPVYRHGKACAAVVEALSPLGFPVIIVDDGNDGETRRELGAIAARHTNAVLVTLEKNSGKGGAFAAGMEKAHELALTHVLQIDADGQHDTSRARFFFERAAAAPRALICGYPEYDDSVPAHRKNGRKFANNWTRAVTWERGIVDAMCGFRIYPVEPTWRFTHCARYDRRMGFDVEVLVRLLWRGVPYEFHGVRVTYPADGVSNFRVVRDNAAISLVFARLCCGMFLRAPLLATRKLRALRPRRKNADADAAGDGDSARAGADGGDGALTMAATASDSDGAQTAAVPANGSSATLAATAPANGSGDAPATAIPASGSSTALAAAAPATDGNAVPTAGGAGAEA